MRGNFERARRFGIRRCWDESSVTGMTDVSQVARVDSPPRWAVERVASAVAAQRAAEQWPAHIDVRRLARKVGLSRSLTSACLRVADQVL